MSMFLQLTKMFSILEEIYGEWLDKCIEFYDEIVKRSEKEHFLTEDLRVLFYEFMVDPCYKNYDKVIECYKGVKKDFYDYVNARLVCIKFISDFNSPDICDIDVDGWDTLNEDE